MNPLRDDRGSATVLSAGIIAALVTVAMIVVAVAASTVDSHKAHVAADLAAVSAATAVYEGSEPCAAAGRTAELNNAVMTSCVLDGADATVAVRVGRAEATARAGPV